jgi:hypothetical protein
MPRAVVIEHPSWWLGRGTGVWFRHTVFCNLPFEDGWKYTVPLFLGAFAKLLRPVCPSVHMDQLGSKWKDFVTFGCLIVCGGSVEKIKVSLKTANNNRHFTCRPMYIIWSYLAQFLEWEMFQAKVIEEIKTKQDQDGTAVPSWSCCCSKAVYQPVWHIPLLSVQWITADNGQRNCPKHVEFHSKIILRN